MSSLCDTSFNYHDLIILVGFSCFVLAGCARSCHPLCHLSTVRRPLNTVLVSRIAMAMAFKKTRKSYKYYILLVRQNANIDSDYLAMADNVFCHCRRYALRPRAMLFVTASDGFCHYRWCSLSFVLVIDCFAALAMTRWCLQ